MRKSILLLFMSASVSTSLLTAQTVTKYEYWINQNAGDKKSGTVDGGSIDFDADVSQLGAGIHTFSFRIQDSEGCWSIPYTKMFCRMPEVDRQPASVYEYWTDHNVSNIKQGTVSNGFVVMDADLSELSEGFHTLTFRTRDGSGTWSVPYTKMFYRTYEVDRQPVSVYEYWTDHNVSNIKQGTVSNGFVVMDADLSELSEGFHTLTFRTRDGSGTWSVPYTKMFYRMPTVATRPVVAYEYYIDYDVDNRRRIDIAASELVDMDVDVSTLAEGIHALSFRTQDASGVWSTPHNSLFVVERNARIIGYEYWFNKEYDERKFEHIEPVEIYQMKNVHIDVTPVWNTSDADEGEEQENVFHIRFRNSKRQWSELISHTFTKGPLQMDLADYEILKAFYRATAGDKWNEVWDISSSEIRADQWNGVNFKGGKVYDIYLPDNNLAGELPAEIFTLSELEKIDLSSNGLYGRIDSLWVKNEYAGVSNVLTSVNLSDNGLQGDVSAFARAIPGIRKLDLSVNQLTDMNGDLPATLVDIDLSGQFVAYIDELTGVPSPVRNAATHVLLLGESMDIPLTTLQSCHLADETEGKNGMPDFLIEGKTGDTKLYLTYDTDDMAYRCSFDSEWRVSATDTLIAVQQSGLAAGYVMNVLLDFAMGDVNIDHIVDVLDVQHSLNYVLSGSEGGILPFNFMAADTYKDGQITVQDIVRTVNLVLDGHSAQSDLVKNMYARSISADTDAGIFIQDGKLVLDTHLPVAAMDITIDNISEGEIRSLINGSRFVCAYRQSVSSLRMLVYSPVGNVFEAGRTELAELYGKDVQVKSATLADVDARYISVSVGDTADGLDVIAADTGLEVGFANGKLVVGISHGDKDISVDYMDMQGRVLAVKECGTLMAGKHTIDIPLPDNGVYMARVSDGRQHKIVKIRK